MGGPSPDYAFSGTVSVVIPAMNEAENIGWVLRHLPDSIDEVLLVDGRSTDKTVDVARSIRRDIVIVEQTTRGKGAALRAGFEAASGDVIVMLDADGSMLPTEIPRFLLLLEDGYDLVKGSRFMTGGNSLDITVIRRLGNRGLVTFVNVLYRSSFSDLCYGFCAFHRRHLDRLVLRSDGFEVETEIVVRAVRSGLRIAEVPSVELPRRSGGSNLDPLRDGRRVLRTVVAEWVGPYGKRRPVTDLIDLTDGAHLEPGVVPPLATIPSA